MGFGFWVLGFGFGFWVLGFGLWALGFGLWVLGFGFGLGFRVSYYPKVITLNPKLGLMGVGLMV